MTDNLEFLALSQEKNAEKRRNEVCAHISQVPKDPYRLVKCGMERNNRSLNYRQKKCVIVEQNCLIAVLNWGTKMS